MNLKEIVTSTLFASGSSAAPNYNGDRAVDVAKMTLENENEQMAEKMSKTRRKRASKGINCSIS